MSVNSYVDITLTGNQVVFSSVSLEFLLTTDLGVTITSAATGVIYTVDAADITVTESPTVTVSISDAKYGPSGSVYVTASGDTVRISRTTPIDSLTRTFSDGSVLKSSDLNSQNKQLLFALQEQADKGVGSLPLDTDDRLDASGKIIKNVATPLTSHHAANLQFVQDAIAAGGVENINSPEAFSLTIGSNFTQSGNDFFHDFSSAPTSTEAKTFLVELDGVLQHPADDYTITVNADDSVRLTILNPGSAVTSSSEVKVRNFGASRNQAIQPFISSSTGPAMKVKTGDGVTTQNTMEIQNSSGTNLAAFTHDGKLQVGTTGTQASQTELRSSTTENAVEVGDYSTGNTAGVEVRQDINSGTNDDFGQVVVSGQSSVSDSQSSLEIHKNGTSVHKVDYGGNVTTAGGIQATGAITSSASLSAPAVTVSAGELAVQGGGEVDIDCASDFSGNISVSGGADIALNDNSDITLSTGNITLASGNIETTTGHIKQPGGLVQKVFFQEDRPYHLADCPVNTVCRLYLVSDGTTEAEVAAGVATDYLRVTSTQRKSTFGDTADSGSDFQRVFFEVSIAPKLAGNKIELRFDSHIISSDPYGHLLFGKTKSDAPLTASQFSGSDLSNATILRARGAGENGRPDYNASNATSIYTPAGSTSLTNDASDGTQDQHGAEAAQHASYLYTVEAGDVGSTLTFHVFFANNYQDDVHLGIHSDFDAAEGGWHRRGMSLLSATEYWA